MTPISRWDPHDTIMANHEASLHAAMNNEDSYARRPIVQAVTTEIEINKRLPEMLRQSKEKPKAPQLCADHQNQCTGQQGPEGHPKQHRSVALEDSKRTPYA